MLYSPTSIGYLDIGRIDSILELFDVIGGFIEVRLGFRQRQFVMFIDSFGDARDDL